MEDRRHLPPDGGGNPKLSSSAVQSECDKEIRMVRKEQSDPETSTQMRVQKDDLCDVPHKVPRFQYVDFPSLHQCIQQLSVPPLNGWLGSCSLAKAPNHRPASPKEKVPKFKYVDYPSLHHCIQQLSVPPLESWSAGLVRLNADGRQEGSGLQKRPSQPGTVRNNQKAEMNETGDQNNKERSRVAVFSFSHTNSIIGKEERPVGIPHRAYTSDSERGSPERVDKGNALDCASRFVSGSGSQTDIVVVRKDRPSVISMVHRDKKQHWTKADHLEVQWNSSDSVEQVPWNTLPESVCPFCQQMFTNQEQFRAHQRSHREKRPN
ncbi:uncharacterized protein si:ch211-284e13.6 [Myxocyprinus asiaticus]|uniref:uncharacterized protein si:ch211-284e13.6 n=1 Tax=Myxocyprinus asiaticus TaxID=70543 RepID=UPI0022233059|nr:uncharacterized protein si:ch211-284e13.6 [Myxocyprinus asiaticus]XP_051534870.1 uncharacterized protein si:ch211-284e13.6 [Myxocyprinus asiaticus]XP_051534877.1 uncharacterized protein si:ch211-284e13.6 [Myxocyprinus asiaticus]XP_051534881.1 uncharacterized protein si:ch211-284e13.6 [Myxocyprinus asiaticus]XP_051534890.1 uncharacterized protein si:ch211-284e13.6 [Myxocyprinus asiaticus]XP_051534899.1 uncharacterized protein si:ch211-284e13.6 [Myxocyprinus asiaticus]XP_051534908.1 uncharac